MPYWREAEKQQGCRLVTATVTVADAETSFAMGHLKIGWFSSRMWFKLMFKCKREFLLELDLASRLKNMLLES